MRIKRKIAPFMFGLTIGLLLGAGLFVFKLNDWFLKLRDSAGEKVTVIQRPVKTVKDLPTKKTQTFAPAPKTERRKFRIDTTKSTDVDYKDVDELIKEDSRITIARDELLSVKNVKVIKISDNNAVTDSAAALAQIGETDTEIMQIEFWKTPLNSKGYRFSKNKMMLYGFPDFSNILVYQMDDDFYLRSADQVFRVEYSADFRQPEKVKDPDLLSRLN